MAAGTGSDGFNSGVSVSGSACGWVIAGESLTAQMLIGAAVIVVSVMLVTANNKRKLQTQEVEIHESLTPTGKAASVTA